jgi:hypothetical protein
LSGEKKIKAMIAALLTMKKKYITDIAFGF